MPDNLCKWKSKYFPGYECPELPLDGDEKGWCILHSEREDKDEGGNFEKKVKERLEGKEEIDLRGCYFPEKFPADYFRERTFDRPVNFSGAKFVQEADFSKARFSKAADFRGAKFSQWADFALATFSEEANFSGATFSEAADFALATFSKADFSGAKFSQLAGFIGATFSEEADFRGAKFSQWAYFSGATFSQAANFSKATFSQRAVFQGAAFEKGVTFDWAEFMGNAFFLPIIVVVGEEEKKMREVKLGDPTSFRHTRFPGDVVFQQVDLRHCSFLHSNIDKVDFRYCKFVNKPDPLLRCIPHHRQNVLKDEIDADKDVGTALVAARERTGTSPTPTKKGEQATGKEAEKEKAEAKVRREKYEPVRRLYLELKKNFEEKKDWNTAGDFHYGEMECRRNMKEGWLRRNILSLEAVYFWLSGYGERPVRAGVNLVILVLLCFLLYYLSDYSTHYVTYKNLGAVKGTVESDHNAGYWFTYSVKTLFWGRFGEYCAEPLSPCGSAIFYIESLFGPTLLALFILALRRKVKR